MQNQEKETTRGSGRVLKFRAWDKVFKKMLYGDAMAILFKEDKNHEIMQHTNLKDKNGREIYEGDIVYFEDTEATKVISYDSNMGWFGINDGFNSAGQVGVIFSEIIGNIYENPELLDKK